MSILACSSSWLLHPLTIYTVQHCVFALIAGYTKPSSIFRPLGFAFLAISSWQALSTFDTYIDIPGWVPRAIASAFPQTMLTYFERMFASRMTFPETDKPTEKAKQDSSSSDKGKTSGERTFKSRWEFGNIVATSMRGIRTPWEIREVHPFSKADPEYVPSPLYFVLSSMMKVVICLWLHTICIDIQMNLRFLSAQYIPLFRRLGQATTEELAERLYATVTTLTALYCFVQGGYSLAATVSVCLKPSTVKDWRPVFGSLRDTYTLRRFWATFWHQGLQNNIRGSSRFIASNILGFRSRTLATRYFKAFLAFFLAGLVHMPTDVGSGVSAWKSGAVQFSCTQIIGLSIEDVAEGICRRVLGTRKVSPPVAACLRMLGYAWVVLFLAWSGPVRWFPVIEVSQRDTELIRWSSLRPLAKAFRAPS